MAVKRLDLAQVAPILHQRMEPELVVPEDVKGPTPDQLLGIAAGDADDRSTYFDTTTKANAGNSPLLVLGGVSLMDYRDGKGIRSRRSLTVVPPSTERRIAAACGGLVENFNAALIALAEHGLSSLKAEGTTLVVRNAMDPHRGARLAVRKLVMPKRKR
jgi:hypothetical protein